jgi:hypothetical protein
MLDLEASAPSEQDGKEWEGEIAADFIIDTARGAPDAFAREVLPRVIEEIKNRDSHDHRGWMSRTFWRRMSFRAFDASTALEQGIGISLGVLAREHPEVLDSLTAPAEAHPDDSFATLLLSAWMENCVHYADKIVCYLLDDPERLALGYLMWGSGNGIAAIGRAAVRSASPHCSPFNYGRLEAAILKFTTKREREDPERLGYHRMLLLECLPSDRISHEARLHFEELKRRFPWEKFQMPGLGPHGGFVGSPIPEEAAKQMSD